MRKLIFSTALALFMSAFMLQAQSLYFCSDYTKNGDPIGVASSWTINSGGGFVHLLYNNNSKPIKNGILAVKIDKEDGKSYTKYDSKVIDVENNSSWATYNYNFKDPGNYKVSVLDNNKSELAKGFVSISLKEKEYSLDDLLSDYTNYNAKMTFCTEIVDGEPADDYTEFTIPPAGGYIYVYVMNDENLNTTGTILTVYKKDYSGKYTEQISKDDYTINGDIPGTYMKYSFYKAGDFKVQLTDKNYNIIATGYVTIKMKGGGGGGGSDYDSRYNAKMTFCTDIRDGKPVDDYTTFNISSSGGYIYVYVMNDKKLGVAKVTLKVTRKSGGSYSDQVTAEDYDINGDIPGTYMQYTFYKAGDYKVELVDKSYNIISTGYVTINMK